METTWEHQTHNRRANPHYYLPAISLQNLNYLWESYFSWYEFQINTAYAFALSVPGVVLLLGVRMWGRHREWFFLLALLIAGLVRYLFGVLRRAAVVNLTSYEKNLLLLIVGSLVARGKRGASPAAAGDGTGER